MKTDSAWKAISTWFGGGSIIWTLLGLALLLLVDAVWVKDFFTLEWRDGHLYGTPVDILHQGSKVMLLALGMTLVIATGGVDLSVGSLMAVAGAIAAWALTAGGMSAASALPLALLVTTLIGSLSGLLVAVLGVQPIVATLVVMVAGRGIAMLVTGGQILTLQDPTLRFIGGGYFLGLPFTVTLVVALLALNLFLTRRTAFGLFIEATGDNETASRFCGVPVRLVKVLVYAFSGFCAALAGIVATGNIHAADSARVGEMMELDAIFAVVVGGTALTGGRFHLLGSLLGALLIQTLTTTMYNLGVPPTVAPVPKAVVIVLVCLLQSPVFQARLRTWKKAKTPEVTA